MKNGATKCSSLFLIVLMIGFFVALKCLQKKSVGNWSGTNRIWVGRIWVSTDPEC